MLRQVRVRKELQERRLRHVRYAVAFAWRTLLPSPAPDAIGTERCNLLSYTMPGPAILFAGARAARAFFGTARGVFAAFVAVAERPAGLGAGAEFVTERAFFADFAAAVFVPIVFAAALAGAGLVAMTPIICPDRGVCLFN
jgi:hypothetical protein